MVCSYSSVCCVVVTALYLARAYSDRSLSVAVFLCVRGRCFGNACRKQLEGVHHGVVPCALGVCFVRTPHLGVGRAAPPVQRSMFEGACERVNAVCIDNCRNNRLCRSLRVARAPFFSL